MSGRYDLNLNGVYIENSNGAAIYWASEDSKIILNAIYGSINYLVEGDYESDESSGAINSENNIDLGGEGTIYIASDFKHAIKGSKVTITDTVELHLYAASDGIHAKEIVIKGGNLYIEGCSDAIQAEFNSSNAKGTIEITDGTIYITDCKTGFKADATIKIDGETIVIVMVDLTDAAFDCLEDGLTINSGSVKYNGENYTIE